MDTVYIVAIILVILFFYHNYFKTGNAEHTTSISEANHEAILMLASIYNNKKLIVDNLEVIENVEIKGNTKIQGNADIKGNTGIEGNADIKGSTGIQGNTNIQGNTEIKGDTVCDKTLKVNNSFTGHIESGAVNFDDMGSRTETVIKTQTIAFSKPFTSTPKIITSLAKIDSAHNKNLRLHAYATNISKTGFTVNCKNGMIQSYIAVP